MCSCSTNCNKGFGVRWQLFMSDKSAKTRLHSSKGYRVDVKNLYFLFTIHIRGKDSPCTVYLLRKIYNKVVENKREKAVVSSQKVHENEEKLVVRI